MCGCTVIILACWMSSADIGFFQEAVLFAAFPPSLGFSILLSSGSGRGPLDWPWCPLFTFFIPCATTAIVLFTGDDYRIIALYLTYLCCFLGDTAIDTAVNENQSSNLNNTALDIVRAENQT